MDGQIREDFKQDIKKSLSKKNINLDYFYAGIRRWSADFWEIFGFPNTECCFAAFIEFINSVRIKKYLRRHKLTTRKGSYHSFDCRFEHRELWSFVGYGAQNATVGNLEWRIRTVDGLKNFQCWFN